MSSPLSPCGFKIVATLSIDYSPNLTNTFYDYFKEYKKDQVDFIISFLSVSDQNLILLRYGSNLNRPVASKEWKKNEPKYINEFCSNLVPRVKKMLNEVFPKNDLEKEKIVK